MTNRAFTLVETLVAIAIITLALLAPFDAIENVISASRIAKDQTIASALAQEGLEYVRFIRDNNYLSGLAYSQILNGVSQCTVNSPCTVDTTQGPGSAIASCSPLLQNGCIVNFNSQMHWYDETSGQNDAPTIYKRYIQVSQSSGYETITSTVSWTDHGSHQIQLVENLYDWM